MKIKSTLHREEPSEKGDAQGDAQVFGGSRIARFSLVLHTCPLVGEDFSQSCHRLGDELISLFHRPTRFIDELDLDPVPLGAKLLGLIR
jgi:hypothetical protein